MTTIAYHKESKTIATDSLMTAGDVISSSNKVKMTKVDGYKFFISGTVADEDLLISSYFGCNIDSEIDCISFVVEPDGAIFEYCVGRNRSYKTPLNENATIGSGEQFALSAMDFGCNAKDAVKYACTRDTRSGGRVRVYSV
jgi:ATP-dependent protease HslVU (ClpYQ) peptidase subunit